MADDSASKESRPTSLYRFYGKGDGLLYIGIAYDGTIRWRDHAKAKPWWGEVTRAEVEHFANRETASFEEVRQIGALKPKYNIQHNRQGGQSVITSETAGTLDSPITNFDTGNQKFYGRYFWNVGLPGGGWITLMADRLSVESGALVAWGRHYSIKPDGSPERPQPDYDVPDGPEMPYLILAAGCWVSHYAASVWTGDPVIVERCAGWEW